MENSFDKRLIKLGVAGLKTSDILRKNPNLWSVSDQFVRSLTSIGANIIEAKSASSRKDYIKFFEIALKSANETKYWLMVIAEYAPSQETNLQTILNEVIEISKILGSSIIKLKKNV